MGNNKMIKTAAAVALGASVVATAVAPGVASAATTYKLKSGKLVNAKTGKVVKGYKVYKSTLYKDGKKAKGYVTFGKVLYKNGKKHTGLRSAKYYKAGKVATGTYKGVYYKTGKKFTGLKSGVYYKSGVKGTGSYKSVYYKNGKKHTGLVGATYYKAGKKGTGSYKGIEYKSGKAVNGLSGDTYYKNGVKASGEVDGVQYFDGAVANGTFHSKLYVDGKVFEGTKEGKLYVAGKVFSGVNAADQKVYVDGVLDETAPVITVAGKQTVAYGASIDEASFVTSVKDNSGEEIKAVVTSNKIDTTKPGNYTVTYTATDKNGHVGKASVEVTVQAPAVESVKAINAEEIKVTFKQAVDATALVGGNYEIELNGDKNLVEVKDVQFADEAKTTVTLSVGAKGASTTSTFTTGDKVVVQVKDAVKAQQGAAIARYTSEVINIADFDAPKLVGEPELNADGKLQVTFDKPVDTVRGTGIVKIDGEALALGNLTLVGSSAVAGSYTYKFTTTPAEKYTTVGTHEVTIFDVYETSRSNPAKTGTVAGSYTIAQDVTAPEVKSVEALNANKFAITFSEAVTLDADVTKSLVIKKGAVKYNVVDAVDDSAFASALTSAAEAKAYVEKKVTTSKGTVVYVVIPEDARSGATSAFANPLYADKENSATLSVEIANYKDKVALLGSKTTKSVTLSKGTATPTEVEGSNVTGTTTKDITVNFDGDLTAFDGTTTVDTSKLVVKTSEGVIVPNAVVNGIANYAAVVVNDAYGKPTAVKITVNSAKYLDSSYTVTFKKEAVKYAKVVNALSTYNFEDTANKEFTTTVGTPDDSNYKYAEFKGGKDYTATTALNSATNENEITVNFGVKLGDSALDASNYTLDGKALPAGTKLSFIDDKQQVQIKFPKESLKSTTEYKLAISTNVKTDKDQSIVASLQKLDAVELKVKLTDNIAPKLESAQYLVGSEAATETNRILVKASEVVTPDSDDFVITVNGNKVTVDSVVNAKNDDEYFIVVLSKNVAVAQAATVELDATKVSKETIASKDAANNQLSGAAITTTGKTLDAKGNNAVTAFEQAKSDLQDLITTADGKKQADYTATSWTSADLTNAITTAKSALNATNATTTTLGAAKSVLQTKIDALVKKVAIKQADLANITLITTDAANGKLKLDFGTTGITLNAAPTTVAVIGASATVDSNGELLAKDNTTAPAALNLTDSANQTNEFKFDATLKQTDSLNTDVTVTIKYVSGAWTATVVAK